MGKLAAIQNAGHADLVDLPDGSWYAVFLASRLIGGESKNLGRESFICPVRWELDWPLFTPDTGKVEWEYDFPASLPWTETPARPARECFHGAGLPLDWCFWGRPYEKCWETGADGLTLRCLPQTLADPLQPMSMEFTHAEDNFVSFAARRRLQPVWRFVPESLEACAGRIRPDEWRVSLAPAADPPVFGPAASVRTLRPVSDEQPAFSGLIRYETALTLDEVPQEAWFVPEQVFESLRLTVNGMEAENGVRLTPPYAVEITGLLKEGKMLSWQRSPRRPRGIR